MWWWTCGTVSGTWTRCSILLRVHFPVCNGDHSADPVGPAVARTDAFIGVRHSVTVQGKRNINVCFCHDPRRRN